MIPINYHHLYYFWVTAKSGSITKAGKELELAQPTLSLQLKQLEKTLGKDLLERRRDGVALTPEGQGAFEYCEKIFTQGEALLRAVREGKRTAPLVLRIGVAPAVTRRASIKVLEAVSRLAPQVRSTVFTGTDAELQSRLTRHTLDVVLAPFDLSNTMGKDFRGARVAELPVSFMCSPDLKRRLRTLPPDAGDLPVLLRSPENPLRKSIESWLEGRRIKTSIVAESEDGYLLRLLAAQGRGVAVLNELACSDNLKEGLLVPLNAKPTGLKDEIWLISGVHPHPEPELSAVIGSLMSRFKISV